MARTDRPPFRRALIWTAATIGVGGLLLAAALFVYASFIAPQQAGDVPSGVACERLPSRAEVDQTLEKQAELVKRIEAVDGVTVEAVPCGGADDGGTEVVVFVPSKAASDAVVDILRDEPFTVPVSIHNV